MPETKAYVGTKLVRAYPGTHEDGREGYVVIYPDGYQSWSPKDTFEAAYREVSEAEKGLIR
jgi:hypothetical protein